MGIHSKFLVHWTGKKDIENFPNNIKAQKYVDRLKDYYQNGLFLRRTTEASIRRLKIKNLLRICFTEISVGDIENEPKRDIGR